MTDTYDLILDDEESRLRKDADGASPYDAALDTEAEAQRQRLNATLNISVGVNADAAARQAGLAAKAGLPRVAVERNEEQVARMQRVRELADLAKLSPVLERQLTDPEFAKVAHDDAENLTVLEQALSWRKKIGGALGAVVPRFNAAAWGQAQALAEGVSKYLTGPLAGTILPVDPAKQAADKFAAFRRDQAGFANDLRRNEDKTSLVEQGVLGGVESLGLNLLTLPAALLTGNPNVALVPMAGVTGGLEYGKARDANKPFLDALAYASSQALVEYATEKLPVSRLMGDLAAGTPFWKLVVRQAAVEIPGEQLATVLQDLNEWAVLKPDAPFTEYLAERPSAAAQTLISTVISVGGQTTITKGVEMAVNKLSGDMQRATAAENDQKFLQDLGALAEASKLRERSPETFAKFVQEAGEDGDVTDVYVSANVLMQTLEQAGVRAAQLPPMVVEQLGEALAAGGDVRIPIGEYSARIAADEKLGPALLEHLKTSPEAMSFAESQVFYQEQAAQLKQQAETILGEQQQNLELQAGADAVKQHFMQQLQGANRFTDSVNEAYASLVRDFYVTTAQRLGITPQEMLARYPLRVAAENVAADVVMDQTTPEFAAWFKDSKVIDEQGQPLRAFHGTTADVSEFNTSLIYATADADYAGRFAAKGNGGNVMPVHLAIRNPHITTDIDFWKKLRVAPDKVRGGLIAEGFDGVKQLEFDASTGKTHTVWVAFHPEQVKSVFNERPTDSPNILEQGGTRPISDAGHKREMATGRYVGAPEWIGKNPQGISALRAKLRQLAREGEPGRHWYENSSKAILDLVGGDKAEAEKMVALIAIYSPNATVPANTSMALTAYFQHQAGREIDAGFGAADKKATELLRDGTMWSGVKTNSFYQNLMVEIDAGKLDQGVATMDMWMVMAFDYGMKAADQGPKYQFMQRETQRLADELGWPAHQAQAAIWTAMKARVDPIRPELKKRELKKGIGHIIRKDDGSENYVIKPDRRADHFHLAHELGMKYDLKPEDVNAAKYDFADAIEGRLVQVSWEATPGESSGALPGIHRAPLEQKREYLDAVVKALTEDGRDLLAEAVGLPQGTTLFGYSAWQGAIGAGAQTFIAVPSEGSGKTRKVKEAPRALLNQYAALKGYVMGQDAVVWHQPVYDDAQIRHNGADIITTRALNAEEMRALYDALHVKFGTWDLAPGYTANGARVLNFVEGIGNRTFQQGVEEVLAALPDDFGGGSVELVGYRSDGEYIGNNWQENPDGEGYKEVLKTGRPDLLERAERLRARVETVNERFAERYGWEAPREATYQQAGRRSAAAARDRGAVAAGLVGEETLQRIPEGYSRQVGAKTPVNQFRRGKHPTAIVGIHYGNTPSLHALNANLFGTGAPSQERNRLGFAAALKKRAYFYAQNKDGALPASEGVVTGAFAYRAVVDNIYDFHEDPEGLIAEWRVMKKDPRAQGIDPMTLLEGMVLNAGYDGYLNRTHMSGAVVVLGHDAVAVEYLGPRQEAQLKLEEHLQRLMQSGRFKVAVRTPSGEIFSAKEGEQLHGQVYDRIARERGMAFMRDLADHSGSGFVGPEGEFLTREQALAAHGFDDALDMPGNENLEQPARGSISFGQDVKQGATIALLKNADLSTFLHELGHLFLEINVDIASQAEAPPAIVEDVNKTLAWFGVKGEDYVGPEGGKARRSPLEVWNRMTLGQKRDHHEKFARGFEAYLFEGNAPNLETRSLFARFRSWLLNVYRSLTALDVELSDEVRGVFDRMLASEEAIHAAEGFRAMAPMFKTQEEAAASEAEWEAYQNQGRDATEKAVLELERRSLADMRWLDNARDRALAKLQKSADGKRDEIRKEVEAEVQQEKVYATMRWLKTGTLPSGEQTVGAKLDLAAMKEMYGEDPAAPWRYLPTGEKGLAGNEGLHPNVVAEMFGYDSGDAVVREILAAEPYNVKVQGLTDQRMLERHGDLVDERAIERAADAEVHSEARARFVAAELRFLSRAMNKQQATPAGGSVNVLAKAAKGFAEQIIARKKVRDIRPAQYAAAETRAAKAADKLRAAGKMVEAAAEKRNQLVNLHATRAATDATEEVEKALRYLRKFDSDGTRKNLDIEYLDQIDQLLERFDLRQATGPELKRRASLVEWMEDQRTQGFEPTIDKALEREARRQNYSTLTLEEFRGLVDAVKNVEHLGRLKKKLLTAKDERELAERVAEATKSLHDNATGRAPERKASDRGPLVRISKLFRGFVAEHRKFASLVREMDGFKDGGVLWELFSRTMNEAGDKEAGLREKATMDLTRIMAPILKGEKLGTKLLIPAVGKSYTREERIGIALNMGNDVNRERILTGESWSPAQLRAVLDTLSKEEWDFVQQVWDYLESWRPAIAEKTRRVQGFEPEWVEAQPVQTKFGEYKGGYYPIKYDPERSDRSEADDAAAVQRQMERGLYVRATTRRGHLEERTKSTGRPMRYDLGVIVQHVDQVVHDLSWHEWLVDANRLLRHLAPTIREHYGNEKHAQLKSMLRDIAVGEIGTQDHLERVLNHIRHGATIVGLGWNVVTAMVQPLGLTQSMVRIGPKWVAKGFAKWLGDATFMENSAAAVHEKSEFMRLRAKTMQREINEIRNQISQRSSALEASYFYLIQKMQLVADMPTWHGAYEKAYGTDDDMTEEKAIALADQAVRDSQGAGQISDLAAIQRGSAFKKLWTNFYSFFNTTYNLAAEKTKERVRKGQIVHLAGDYLLLFILPSVIGTIMKAMLAGDDEEELARKLLADQISYILGTMVGAREIGTAFSAAVGMQTSYGGPAGLRFFAEMAKFGKQVGQGEFDEALLKSGLNVLGIIFHLPTGQITRTLDGIDALVSGDTPNPGALLVGSKANN